MPAGKCHQQRASKAKARTTMIAKERQCRQAARKAKACAAKPAERQHRQPAPKAKAQAGPTRLRLGPMPAALRHLVDSLTFDVCYFQRCLIFHLRSKGYIITNPEMMMGINQAISDTLLQPLFEQSDAILSSAEA